MNLLITLKLKKIITMKITDYIIEFVRAATPAQVNVGINGSFSLKIETDEGTLISLRDLTIRTTKEGKAYIGQPYRTGEKKEGNDKVTKYYYYDLFNNNPNREKLLANILAKAKQALDAVGSKNTTSKPAPTAAKQSPDNDAW